MNTRIRFPALLRTVAIFCAATISAIAAPSAADPIVSANIKCLSLGQDLRGVEMLLVQEKRMPVHAAASYISSNHSYRGPQRVVFVKARKPASESTPTTQPSAPLPEQPVLATVELAPTGGDYLFLFSGSADTKLEVVAIPFSSKDVPFGSCLVSNVTQRQLGVVMGGDRGLLAPRQRQLFRPAKQTKEYFDLRIFDEYQGAPRALAGGPHFLKENSRQLIFIVDRAAGGAAVQVRVIEEMPELAAR